MAKTNWQDPKSSEIISPHVSGLQEATGKLEEAVGMSSVSETGIALTEVYISDSDRYRIFQAVEGKRNWLSSPTPIIYQNGVIMTTGFSIDYGGGAIILNENGTESNVYTSDATFTQYADGTSLKQNISNIIDGTSTVGNASKLGGQLPAYYAKQEDVGNKATLVTDNKTNLVSAINEVKTQNNDLADKLPDNAGAHNSIFRGKNIGVEPTVKQYADIANGNFEDMYIGDYWTKGGVIWRISAFNYFRNTGDSLVPGNHITIVPDTQLYSHVMNGTNITTGGYTGSEMYIEGLEQAKTTIRGIFGTHLIKHRQIFSNASIDGKASGWAWIDSEVDLMSEIMVYGSVVWGESTIGGSGYNIGVGKSQLPLFALNPQSINTRQSYWLRDVVSASDFACMNLGGNAIPSYASASRGVRPAFSIS